MKLTGKIILIYLCATALLTTIYAYGVVRREDERLRKEIEQHAEGIGVAMESQLVVTWQQRGNQGVGQIIRLANDQHEKMSIRWIALKDGSAEAGTATSMDHLQMMEGGHVMTVVSRTHQHMYYPIDIANERAGCLEFSQPLSDVKRYTRGTIYHTGMLLLGILLCGAVVTFLGISLIGRRLDQLIAKTKRIAHGDFDHPLQLSGNDELNQLANALNEMSQQLAEQQQTIQAESAARLAAVEQLQHADRLKTIGRLASGIAHELGTPLNVVSGRAELIASGRLDEQQSRESALAIKSESDRMETIIRQLLDFARRRPPQRSSVDLVDLAEQCVELLQSLASQQHVELVVTGSGPIKANVDAGQITQVLTNLVVNSIQAMPDGGTVKIDLSPRKLLPAGATSGAEQMYCAISVQDEGTGISADDRQHLFEPFFTTKDVGKGTGLGLSLSYGIVQDHDGWIDVQSEPGEGSCFTVFLPID